MTSKEISIKVGEELDPQGFGECPWCEDDGDLDTENVDQDHYYFYCNNCEGEVLIRMTQVVAGLTPPQQPKI